MRSTHVRDVRHQVVERIDALDGDGGAIEALIAEAGRERDELRRRVHEADGAWERVMRTSGDVDPEVVGEAFSALCRVRAELAGVGERRQALIARHGDLLAEREALRAVFNTLEDVAASSGSPDGDLANLRQASRRLFQGIEEQRRRVARDLREGPARATAAAVARAEALERSMRFSRYVSSPELAEIEVAVRSTVTETRALIASLDAVAPDDLGVIPSLRRLVREFADRSGITAELRSGDGVPRLTAEGEGSLFRIVQEALDNVARHAGAGRVEVTVDARPQGTCVAIVDDGSGFDVIDAEASLDRTTSFGLVTMRERAAASGAALQIHSRIGRGTEVRLTFPP